MILLFELTFLGVLLSLVYGWLLEFAVVGLFKLDKNHDLHFSVTILLGVALLAGLLGIWSLFSKIGLSTLRLFWAVGIYLLLVCIQYVFIRLKVIYRQVRSLHLLSWLVLVPLVVYALYLASASDVTYDTGLYHAQSIRWIESYPVVPGIANIHDRLGFNSNLFLLSAFWGLADKGEHAYQVPGLIIFIAFVFLCLHLIENSRKNFNLSGLGAIVFLIYLLIENGMLVWLASPTADLSAGLLSWAVFLLAAEKLENDTEARFDILVIAICVLGLFVITVKLSTVPVTLVLAYFILRNIRNLGLSKLISLATLAVVVVLPWLVRNIFISGYLVYPFYQLDIFNLDWKVPRAVAVRSSETITAWGRIPHMRYSLVMSLPFDKWFPIWYKTLPPADYFLIMSVFVGAVLLGLTFWINRHIREIVRPYSSIYLVLITGCVYWFVQSPSPRFGYGFLVSLLCFEVAPFLVFLVKRFRFSGSGVMLLCQAVLAGYIVHSMAAFPVRSWRHYLYAYKPYPAAALISVRVGNMNLFVMNASDELYPNNDAQCWYESFPCAPKLRSGLTMRGETIEDGFYINENGQ